MQILTEKNFVFSFSKANDFYKIQILLNNASLLTNKSL